MTEKLKIYVTPRIAEILAKDTEGFEFYKKDGRTLNKNALLTKLVVNYHNKFAREQEELFAFLKERIHTAAAADTIDGLCFDILEKLNERNAAADGEKFNVLVSLKPTRESQPVLDYIEQYALSGRTLSEYFRSMFASYASLPQDKREEIIFQPQYDAIVRAIREKKKVFLSTTGRKTNMEIAPYAIANSKEEMHLYVLGVQKTCAPLRLSRITKVTRLSADAVFTEENVKLAEKMIKYGPQFNYRADEREVVVELTQKGVERYKKIYVHRPVPDRVEGNRYIFHCSYTQIVQYFVRFGGDAEVVSPQEVRDMVVSFHRWALWQYEKSN